MEIRYDLRGIGVKHDEEDLEVHDAAKRLVSEVVRLRKALLKIEQQSMETHIRMRAHQALQQNEAQILATNTYEAEGRN